MDPIRFRTRGVDFNVGTSGLGNRFSEQNYKISSKKPKVKSTFILEKLLREAERRLEKIKEEIKTTYSDGLLDEYTKIDNSIRQLKWQIAVRKGK